MTGEAPSSGLAQELRLSLNGLGSDLAGPFDLELAAGACAAVTGASGSGKSLLLRMIADLDPNRGEVRLGGRLREAFAPPEWRRLVSYVAAEAAWWTDTVEEHFAPTRLEAAKTAAAGLGLDAAIFAASVARLSTGERQRLGLVRALALQPRVLLLDEPTGALDPASVARVETLLSEAMADGAAVVLVTHDLPLARRLAGRVYVMAGRRLSPS